MAVRAGIYARISMDRSGEGLGVGRQLEDCRKLAASRDWPVVDEYVDNDVSASTGKLRPRYEAMLRDIRHGHITGVIVWDVDRLTRRPIEIEQFLELADDHNVALACVGGDIDIGSDMGRVQLRVGAAFARGEVDKKARRQRRQHLQAAEAGRMVGGRRAFGYTADGMALVPEEAALVVESYRRFVTGDTLGSIARWLTTQGSTTPRGHEWTYRSVRTFLSNPRNAGLRGMRRLLPGKAGRSGQREQWHAIIGDAAWPAIVDRDTWEAVMIQFKDPRRGEGHVDNRQRYLLSGIAECGRCGEKLITGRRDGERLLKCPTFHLSRRAEPVEALVLDVVEARLRDRVALSELAASARDRAGEGELDLSALRARVDALRALKAGLLTPDMIARFGTDELLKAAERYDEERGGIERQLAERVRGDRTAELFGARDPQSVWESWPLSLRRELIAARLHVVVLRGSPGRPGGRRFDPSSVSVSWRR